MIKEFPAGRLSNIKYVAILTRYRGKWVYAFHGERGSYEHPGGHVEPGETAAQAARRELYEETGITKARLYPLWDYEYMWRNGKGRNNGRVYFAEVDELGELPECSEMTHVMLYDTVPENYTYEHEKERRDIRNALRMIRAIKETLDGGKTAED